MSRKPPAVVEPAPVLERDWDDQVEDRIHDLKALTAALVLAGLGKLWIEDDHNPVSQLAREYGDGGICLLADRIGDELDELLELAFHDERIARRASGRAD